MVFTMPSLPLPLQLNSAYYFVLNAPLAFFFCCNDIIVILGTTANIYVDDEFKAKKPQKTKTLLFSEVKLKGIMLAFY